MIASDEKIAKARQLYGRSIDEILSKEPKYDLYQILGAIEVLVGAKIYKKFETSSSERMIFALTWLAREVQNGGFHQYFLNSAGDFWEDVADGLVAIGDHEGWALFRKATDIFPQGTPSKNRLDRQAEMSALDDEQIHRYFGQLTNDYFIKPFPDWGLVFDYVKRNRNAFDLQNA
jgi:hypothetical protein